MTTRIMQRPSSRHTCSASCASGLRADNDAGAIYGPFPVNDPLTGESRFGNRDEFAAQHNQCIYCSGPLPRGRAKRLAEWIRTRALKRREATQARAAFAGLLTYEPKVSP